MPLICICTKQRQVDLIYVFIYLQRGPNLSSGSEGECVQIEGSGPCILSYKLLGDFIFIAFLHSVSRNIIPRFIDLLRH